MSQPHGNSNEWSSVNGTTTAAASNVSLKAAPGTGLALFVTDVIFSNEGAANQMMLLDGSGGTAKVNLYLPTNTAFHHSFETPLKLTSNTALCWTTTANDHSIVTVCGFTARG